MTAWIAKNYGWVMALCMWGATVAGFIYLNRKMKARYKLSLEIHLENSKISGRHEETKRLEKELQTL